MHSPSKMVHGSPIWPCSGEPRRRASPGATAGRTAAAAHRPHAARAVRLARTVQI
jgi:hypothetical protein